MPWKQCKISINASYARLLEGVRLLTLANCNSPEIALFTRTTPDHEHRVLLLSPKAIELAGDTLPDCWTECDAPELFEWDPVWGPPQACERFGLRQPRFGRAATTPPITFGGAPEVGSQ